MVGSITTARSEQGALFLPPGFRFHPTDEEVITSYLLQKLFNPSFTSRAVGEVDLNKCEPWDLPSKATMGEDEWYFFCHKDMKYPTGMRTNRATKEGYWKATGKDRKIFSSNKNPVLKTLVGMKKTLVFYMGRPPRGSKTNWVMHEFRLEGNSRNNANLRVNPKDEWVVSKVFHKKGETKTKDAVEYSAGTTPDVSSVDAGEGDDFLRSMIDPVYFNNSASSLPAKTTINTASPYSADYSISTAAGSTSSSTGSFVLPNYSLINPGNQQFAVANPVPASISSSSNSSSSCWNMLPAAGPAHGRGSYNNNVSLHQDEHQAAMVKALGGVIDPNSGVSRGLPSSAMAGVSKQQNYRGVPQNKLWSYGHPYSSHLTTRTATGSAENLGARLVHY